MSKIDTETTEFEKYLHLSGLEPKEAAEKLGISLRTLHRWKKGDCSNSPACKLATDKLKEISRGKSASNSHKFTYIDLFAGIGGFRKAFDPLGGKCVFTSEWNAQCRVTYTANHECDHPVVGDIREFTNSIENLSKIPKHDLLVAGFPCQPFSIAGVSKKNALGKDHGFKCDTQGTLFFDLAQIIDFHKPPMFLLENVKNLVSHDKGNTFKVIKRTLEEELNYTISYRVIDGKSWVPQHRERIFIVGIRKDLNYQINLNDLLVPDINEGPKLGSILHGIGDAIESELPYVDKGKPAEKYTLTPNLWKYLVDYKAKHQAKGNGFGYSLFGQNDIARTLSARYYKDGSEILINRGPKSRPRRLTPRECSRLMGFDGPGESNFRIPVSDTQAYHQFGNSVVVPCAKAVAEFILPTLEKAIKSSSNNAKKRNKT